MVPVPKRRRLEVVTEKSTRRSGQSQGTGPATSVQSSIRQAAAKIISQEDEYSDEEQEKASAHSKPYWGLLGAFRVNPSSRGIPESSESLSLKAAKPANRTKNILHTERRPIEDVNVGHESEDGGANDPFETHFANPDEALLSEKLKCISMVEWTASSTVSALGKHTIRKPSSLSSSPKMLSSVETKSGLALKERLRQPYEELTASLGPLNDSLLPVVSAYQDVLYCGRSVDNAESLRSIACLHSLNHVLRTRDRIIRNNTRLAQDQGQSNLECRDQGFTRPKVLILLETRQSCVRYVASIIKLFCPEQQENRKRFEDSFIQVDNTVSEDQPPDFRELFDGNNDNEFRLGLKFTRRTMKYFSQFYASDFIFASPLGLRRAIKTEDPKRSDHDFLSSIEVVIIDQADAMLMQNWEHVDFVLNYVNLQPKEAHDCDFSRVRKWYLDGNARHIRQMIVFSAYLTPELNGLFSTHMQNVAGKEKIVTEYTGSIMDIGIPIRQIFTRFHCRSPRSDPDERFKFFTTTVVPTLNKQVTLTKDGLGALIFIPSYLDFVRVRNYFSTSPDAQNLTFGSISEYTDKADSRRARSHFFAGRQSVMLYTGRAHHFHRYRLRGVKSVVMYGVPENDKFYVELVAGYVGDAVADSKVHFADTNVRVLFSKWDLLSLERIVGSKRVGRMVKDGGDDTFEFA